MVKFQKIVCAHGRGPGLLNMVFSGVLIHVRSCTTSSPIRTGPEMIADQWISFVESGVKARGWHF